MSWSKPDEKSLNFNFKQVETFVWVARLQSFKRAAEQLHTTQPNISNRVAGLEAALDCKLFDRDAGSVRLTKHGQELLPQAIKVLQEAQEFQNLAVPNKHLPGTIRLGVTEMVVHSWLPAILQEVKLQLPNAIIEIVVDLSVNLEQLLIEDKLDIAIQNGPFKHNIKGHKQVAKVPFTWVASPSLKLSSQKLKTKELLQHPVLTHSRDTRQYREIRDHFSAAKSSAQLVPSSSLSACIQMAIDGFGVSAILSPMVEKPIRDKRLQLLDYSWKPRSLEFSIRYHSELANIVVTRVSSILLEVIQGIESHDK